ncbi:MAG: protein kinase, partial [Kofleriaceae bacterium]|nr:protein kinase [Kofleriaceae bacterium]
MGRQLGRYQLVKHLASGGMAEVLLARVAGIEGFQRHVVIKRIRPGQAQDREFVQMFLNEARLAAQLHHANIVQVHDIGQEGDEYFFAMEYVHGEDLRLLLQQLARTKSQLPLQHVVSIVSAAANALHHAHEQRGADRKPLGIVHRDVTPANILVGYDGNIKVVDFGIAKAIARSTIETQAGTLKGKASYMSPEQCGGADVDRRSDVFALGIVLYELVTTRRLFKAANDFLTMSSIVSGKVPPPRTHRPDLPSSLEAIILKALALRPEDRFQTADDMREALEDFASMQGLRTSTSQLAAYMKQTFGEKPEPWLVEDDDVEVELTVDFDGSASGLAPAPQAAIDAMTVPDRFDRRSSPIMKARTRAASELPPSTPARGVPSQDARATAPSQAVDAHAEVPTKRPLPGAAPVAKPKTQQIPIMPVAGFDKSKGVRRPEVAPAPVAPRRKPITVQIPVANQAAGIQASPT